MGRFLAYALTCITSLSLVGLGKGQAGSAPVTAERPAALEVIQVDNPVKIPPDANCTVKLMEYSFGWSYDKPFVGKYTPPSCTFNRVALTFTVTSAGRQFDRLALMYLKDTEIWRTSTAEPNKNGIIWTYKKDVSQFLPLWKQPQPIIFDLGNLIDDTYTGLFNTTLEATFFNGPSRGEPADVIMPVSKMQGSANKASAFRLPEDGRAGVSWKPPQNARKAIFSISACGQAEEEFWWSNVPQSQVKAFDNNTMLGFSPFRELQLMIDGQLAGVAWPFPVIFTGGIVPAFWRPLVGIDTYDLKEDEIDITPWLPVISDGKDHVFEIKIMGLDDDGSGKATMTPVGSNWVITGKIFMWLDQKPGAITTGNPPKVTAPEPVFAITQTLDKTENGTTKSLSFKVTAQRNFTVDGTVITSEGERPAGWKQNLQFTNNGWVADKGNLQVNDQVTAGLELSAGNYSRAFKYPLTVNQTIVQAPGSKDLSLTGKITRAKTVRILGEGVLPSGLEFYNTPVGPDVVGYTINTTQVGEAAFQISGNTTTGYGFTDQMFNYQSEKGTSRLNYPNDPKPGQTEMLYQRHVLAKNGKITRDETLEFDSVNPTADPPIRVDLGSVAVETMTQPLDPKDIDLTVGRKLTGVFRKPASKAMFQAESQTPFIGWWRYRRSI